jgi:hypothetical protein
MADPSKLGLVTVGSSADPEVAITALARAISRHVEKINGIVHLLYPYDDTGKGGVSSVAADPRYTLAIDFAANSITPICTGIDGTSLYAFSGTEDMAGTPAYQTIHPLLKKVDNVDPTQVRPRTIYESFVEVIAYIDSTFSEIITESTLDEICDSPIDCSTPPVPGDVLIFDGVSWAPGVPGGGIPATSGTRFAVLQEDPASTPVFQLLPEEGLLGALTLDITGTTEYEVGETATNPAFVATYERDGVDVSGSVTATTLDDSDANPTDVLAAGEPAPTSTHSFTKTSPGDQVAWTLTADDPYVTGATAEITATWKGRVYWGIFAAGLGSGDLAALAASAGGGTALVNGPEDITFTVEPAAAEFFYFLVPQDMVPVLPSGRIPHPILNANGFYLGEHFGGTDSVTPLTVTNAHGLSVDYWVYKSTNDALGFQRIDVLAFTDEVS